MASSSSGASSKSNTLKFSAMRSGLRGLRDGRAPLLQVPAEHDLGGRLAVLLRDLEQGLVLEGALLAVPVKRDAADGRPRLGNDAVGGVRANDVALLEVGVHLDLVDRGDDLRGLKQRVR